MENEADRWDRSTRTPGDRQQFQSKASSVALYADANRKRNLDKEEAARDRVIFRWVLLLVGVVFLMGMLFFVVTRLFRSE